MPKATSGDAVRVEGLAEFQRSLKKLGPEWNKKLGELNKKAGETVAETARGNAAGRGGVAGHVAPSIKSSAAAREATVSIGSDAFPMALGAEFGAKRFPQFDPFKGNQWEGDGGPGYVLSPAVTEKAPELEETYLNDLYDLSQQAFPD